VARRLLQGRQRNSRRRGLLRHRRRRDPWTGTATCRSPTAPRDVIKSGGEWISSIDLENLAVGHPKVAEGRRDRRAASEMGRAGRSWSSCSRKTRTPARTKFLGFMQGKIAKWWMPRRRRLRRGNPAYGDRQDPENGAPRTLQELSAADRGGRDVEHGAPADTPTNRHRGWPSGPAVARSFALMATVLFGADRAFGNSRSSFRRSPPSPPRWSLP